MKLDAIRATGTNPVDAPHSPPGGARTNEAASGSPPLAAPAMQRWVDKNGEVHWSDRQK